MRAEKKYLIDEVTGHLKKSDYVILTNFTKLTVAETAELRKRLAPEAAEFHVVKNSSFRVAAKAFGLPEVDKTANIGVGVGKRSFTPAQISENVSAVLEAVGKAKPAAFKGHYIKSVTLSSSMSPGVKLAATEFNKF